MNEITNDDEISLADILAFLQDTWKTILGVGIAGGLAGGGLLALAPAQYEAEAMIEMAQIRTSGPNGGSVMNPIEPPALLIERLKNPSAYTAEAIQACAAGEALFDGESMAKLVKASIPKNITTVAELKVRRSTPALAEQCAKGLFEMVSRQQAALLKPQQEEMRATLAGLQTRFGENQNYVAKAEKAGLYNVVYLARRDESIYLIQQIDELQRALAREAQARLVSPVYASPQQVFPKRNLTLVLGLMGGLMLGLLFTLGRRVLQQQRTAA
jgi:hypothetical protein